MRGRSSWAPVGGAAAAVATVVVGGVVVVVVVGGGVAATADEVSSLGVANILLGDCLYLAG